MATSRDLVTAIISLVTGGGVAAILGVVLKAPKERGKVVIESAQGAVIVQSGVIEDLRDELDRLRVRQDDLERENDSLRDQLADERAAKRALAEQNVELHERVRVLEEEVEHLRAQVDLDRTHTDEDRARVDRDREYRRGE